MTPTPPWDCPTIPTLLKSDFLIEETFLILNFLVVIHPIQIADAHFGTESVPGIHLLSSDHNKSP